MRLVNTYEPNPCDGAKSFYGKALVKVFDDGSKILQSYQTDVLYCSPSGEIFRLWSGWSLTTGRHIYSFCGLRKKEYESLPFAFVTESVGSKVKFAN